MYMNIYLDSNLIYDIHVYDSSLLFVCIYIDMYICIHLHTYIYTYKHVYRT
jgi:hypothetical protein